MDKRKTEILYLCLLAPILFFAISYIASFVFAGFFLNGPNNSGWFGMSAGDTGKLLTFGSAGLITSALVVKRIRDILNS